MLLFFFKQKTAYEMRISDWSSDVCSSDLAVELAQAALDEENSKLDIAQLRCNQSTEDAALSAFLAQADSGTVSNFKSAKYNACKAVQILADLQDKREKLNDFRTNGYPLFFLHAKEKIGRAHV